MGAGLYLRRGGGGNGLIFKHISTGRLGLGAGGGGEPYPASLCPGAQKSKFPGGRGAPI